MQISKRPPGPLSICVSREFRRYLGADLGPYPYVVAAGRRGRFPQLCNLVGIGIAFKFRLWDPSGSDSCRQECRYLGAPIYTSRADETVYTSREDSDAVFAFGIPPALAPALAAAPKNALYIMQISSRPPAHLGPYPLVSRPDEAVEISPSCSVVPQFRSSGSASMYGYGAAPPGRNALSRYLGAPIYMSRADSDAGVLHMSRPPAHLGPYPLMSRPSKFRAAAVWFRSSAVSYVLSEKLYRNYENCLLSFALSFAFGITFRIAFEFRVWDPSVVSICGYDYGAAQPQPGWNADYDNLGALGPIPP
ncbi:hypothetical protein B0H13DRAFT_1897085 [Mycena leptocephala]|nr:hypothetical protein B0H13DRAFT_1897085 [Mycena leptocephala]